MVSGAARGKTDGRQALLRARLRLRPGPARLALLRKLLAGLLLVLAAVLAFAPVPASGEPTEPVVVSTRDLAPGTMLRPADLRVARFAEAARPAGALRAVPRATGRVLAGAARTGEPITDVRLAGPANTALVAPGSTAVPVRLADPAIAELLRPGARVDVVTLDQQGSGHRVLARDAAVITVLAARREAGQAPANGRLVLVALPERTAARVAAVALGQTVTFTLR